MRTYTCPVCGYPDLSDPPQDFEICPSCGTEFGYHDIRRSHKELRRKWIARGAHWQSEVIPRPDEWNALAQLIKAGFSFGVGSGSADRPTVAQFLPPSFRVKLVQAKLIFTAS